MRNREAKSADSARVRLDALTYADLPKLWQWINERDEVLFNSGYKPVDEAQHRNWFEAIQQRADVRIFGIRLGDSGELIGSCQLHSIKAVDRTAELQIRLGNVAHRGKGYGTEAVRLLLQFAFTDLNLNRVYLHVFAGNAPAIQVYEKCGFIREGTLRRHAYVDGGYVDVVIMGILCNEYVEH